MRERTKKRVEELTGYTRLLEKEIKSLKREVSRYQKLYDQAMSMNRGLMGNEPVTNEPPKDNGPPRCEKCKEIVRTVTVPVKGKSRTYHICDNKKCLHRKQIITTS